MVIGRSSMGLGALGIIDPRDDARHAGFPGQPRQVMLSSPEDTAAYASALDARSSISSKPDPTPAFARQTRLSRLKAALSR